MKWNDTRKQETCLRSPQGVGMGGGITAGIIKCYSASEALGGLVKIQIAGPISRVFNSVGLGGSLGPENLHF